MRSPNLTARQLSLRVWHAASPARQLKRPTFLQPPRMRQWKWPLLRTLIPLLRRKRRLARFSHSMAWSLGRRGSTSFDTCSATTVHGTGCRLSHHVTGRTVHGKVRVSLQAYLLVTAIRARVYHMQRPKHTPRSSACCVVSTCGRARRSALWRCLPVCWPRPRTTAAQVACFYVVKE